MAAALLPSPGASRGAAAPPGLPPGFTPLSEFSLLDLMIARFAAMEVLAARTAAACSDGLATESVSAVPQVLGQRGGDAECAPREAVDLHVADPSPTGDPALEEGAGPLLAGCRPQYVHDLTMSQLSWRDLESRREWRTELLLRGLPRKMCSSGALEALLRANGLLDSVTGMRTQCAEGKRAGCAILRARSVSDVAKIGRFFHGRQFGCSMPVAVSFFAGQSEAWRARAPRVGA